MRRQAIFLGTLTISNGQQVSNEFKKSTMNTKVGLGTLVDLMVYAPATLPDTVNAQASYIEEPTTEWHYISVAGTRVSISAENAEVIPSAALRAFRLRATAPVGADRVFKVVGQVDT
jgi:hypothetical protein